jgi:hypothetical protein
MEEEAKLIPRVTRELKPFFDAAQAHQLAVQKCDHCGALRFPAAPLCLACDSDKARWVPVSGRGEVFSFTVMHRAYHPAFKAPYTLAVIELQEGVRMTSNVISGVRVSDITQYIAGPMLGRMLADLGVEVVKLEMPPGGEYSRHGGFPPRVEGQAPTSVYYNRGKRSLCIDFKRPAGAAHSRLSPFLVTETFRCLKFPTCSPKPRWSFSLFCRWSAKTIGRS